MRAASIAVSERPLSASASTAEIAMEGSEIDIDLTR
jgi:hypothetical protein